MMTLDGRPQEPSGPEQTKITINGQSANISRESYVVYQVNNYNSSESSDKAARAKNDNPISTMPNLPALVGREEELKQIATEFQNHTTVVLTGVSGIGKSHLAWSFANSLSNNPPFDKLRNAHRLWVSGCCYEYFLKTYREIARTVGKSESTDSDDLFHIVREWLNNPENGSWMLILDDVDMGVLSSKGTKPGDGTNADTPASVQIRDFIPRPSSGGNGPIRLILATTQDAHVLGKINPHEEGEIKVRELDMDACQHLLSSSMISSDTPEDVAAVANSLGQHPAAIVSAKAFIELNRNDRDGFGIAAYQARIRQKGTWNTLMEHDTGYSPIPSHGKELYNPWVMSLEDIWKQNSHAIRIFGLMCCFNRNCIPNALITGACEREQGIKENDIDDHLALLSQYGLINFCDDGERRCHRISRLVVLAARHWLWNERSSDPACSEDRLHQTAITAITEYYRSLRKSAGDNIFEQRQITSQILPHLQLIAQYCRTRSPLRGSLESNVVAGLVEIASLYTEVGRYDSAGAILTFAAKNCSGKDRWSAVAFRDLADTLCRPDTHPKEDNPGLPESLLLRAISITQQLEDRDLEIKISFSLPCILLHQGKADVAFARHNELIDKIRVHYGQEHLLYCRAIVRKGILHYENGFQDLAKKALEQALDHLGATPFAGEDERNYCIFEAKASLARVLDHLRNFNGAGKLMLEVYQGRKELLGENDIKTLNSGIDLAFHMLDHDAPQKSESLLREIEARILKVGGRGSECMKRCQKALTRIVETTHGNTGYKAMDGSAIEDMQVLT